MRFAMITLALVAAVTCGGVDAKLTCESKEDCLDGYGCDSSVPENERFCLRQCTTNTNCLASQTCDTTAGLCRRQECTTGETNCGGDCVNTGTDAAHCGACGNACAATAVCDTGTCRCGGAGGDACTDDQGDGCSGTTCECGTGAACATGAQCTSGACLCAGTGDTCTLEHGDACDGTTCECGGTTACTPPGTTCSAATCS